MAEAEMKKTRAAPTLSDLPEDMVARVMLLLPMRDLLRSGAVCCRWRDIIRSAPFRASWSQLEREEDWYLPFFASAAPPTICLAFSLAQKRWLSMPGLSFLSSSVTIFCTSTGVFESAHRGLFCKWNYLTSYPALVVCNPVTRACRTLPCLDTGWQGKSEYCATHLRVDADAKAYNVIVVKTSGESVLVCNYESRSNSWDVWSTSSSRKLSLLYYANSVLRDGFIYCVGRNRHDWKYEDSPYHCLFAYDVQGRDWRYLCELPDDEKTPMLVQCSSGILVITSNARVFRKGLTVYKLDSTSGRLSEIAQLPDEFDHFWRFVHNEYQTSYLHPVGLGDLICFPTTTSKQALVYDLSSDCWSYWPSGPFNWPDRPEDRRSAAPIPPLRFPVNFSFVTP